MSTEHTMDDRPTGAEPGPTPGEPPTSGSAAASSGDGDRQVKSRSAAPLLPGSAASSSGDGNRGGLPETPTPLLPGTVDLLILKTLSVEANHGYGIARRLRQVSDEVLLVEEGTLYPALHRLEKRGDLESEWRRSERNRRATGRSPRTQRRVKGVVRGPVQWVDGGRAETVLGHVGLADHDCSRLTHACDESFVLVGHEIGE